MDTLSFIAELVKALAWPATVIVGVALLRQPLLQLIPSLRKLRYKDLELEFERKLEQVKAQMEEAQLPESKGVKALSMPTVQRNISQNVERIADTSPRAAVAEAWRYVEAAIQEALRRRHLSPPKSLQAQIRLLQDEGILTPSAVSLLKDLMGLRNQAVHVTELQLTPGQALEYGLLAERLVEALTSGNRRTE